MFFVTQRKIMILKGKNQMLSLLRKAVSSYTKIIHKLRTDHSQITIDNYKIIKKSILYGKLLPSLV